MIRQTISTLIAVLAVSGGACSAAPATPSAEVRLSTEAPSIVGMITAIENGRVRIEERPEDPSGSAKAVVRLTPQTVIFGHDRAIWPVDSLRVGRRVRAWYSGPVAESYPVQTNAGIIQAEPPPSGSTTPPG